jgi:hypothetical protein
MNLPEPVTDSNGTTWYRPDFEGNNPPRTKQAAYYDPSDYFTNDSDKYHYDVPSDPTLLHRGVGFGKGELPPELEKRIEAVKAGESDPKLGADLITHMGRDGQGLGGFWTHSKDGPWLAEGYSRRTHHGPWDNNQADHSVVLSGDWDGNNGDLEHAFDADYRKLNPGAPIHVHTVRLHTPKGWVSLGGDPEGTNRYASGPYRIHSIQNNLDGLTFKKSKSGKYHAVYDMENGPDSSTWTGLRITEPRQVGFVLVDDEDDEGDSVPPWVRQVWVHPNYQRRGIAHELWQRAGRPQHTPWDQSPEGKAWAEAVGGTNAGDEIAT